MKMLGLVCGERRVSAACALITLIVASGFSEQAFATTCDEDNGNAVCIGPEKGEYRYQVASFILNGVQGTSEAQTIADFSQMLRDWYHPCTFNESDNRPPWPAAPEGSGTTSNGDYSLALFYGVGQYWSMNWLLSTDQSSYTLPLVYGGTYPNSGQISVLTKLRSNRGICVPGTRSQLSGSVERSGY